MIRFASNARTILTPINSNESSPFEKDSSARIAASDAIRRSPKGLDCPSDRPRKRTPGAHSSSTSATQTPAGVRVNENSEKRSRSRRASLCGVNAVASGVGVFWVSDSDGCIGGDRIYVGGERLAQ